MKEYASGGIGACIIYTFQFSMLYTVYCIIRVISESVICYCLAVVTIFIVPSIAVVTIFRGISVGNIYRYICCHGNNSLNLPCKYNHIFTTLLGYLLLSSNEASQLTQENITRTSYYLFASSFSLCVSSFVLFCLPASFPPFLSTCHLVSFSLSFSVYLSSSLSAFLSPSLPPSISHNSSFSLLPLSLSLSLSLSFCTIKRFSGYERVTHVSLYVV